MALLEKQPNIYIPEGLVLSRRMWLLAGFTGAATGLAGGLLMRLLRAVQHVGFGYSTGAFQAGVEHASPHRRVACLLLAGLVMMAAVAIRQRRPFKGEAGLTSGLWKRGGRIPFLPGVFEAIQSIIVVGLGVSLGREAALKQAGAVLASPLANRFGFSNEERRVLVAIAAGAGMGAAYNIPLGGALLAAEVYLGTLALPVVILAVFASGVGTAVSWLLLPIQPTYATPGYALHLRDLVWALLAAPFFGVLAALWVRAIAWARQHKPEGWLRYAAPLLVFALLGAVAMWFPDLLGNGKGLVQETLAGMPALRLLGILLVLKLLASAGCLATGTPGGLFTPTMSLGALCGALLGRLWALALPGTNPGAYALIGTTAVLAVATQGPISAIVMVMELTHHAEALIVPILIATTGASWVAKRAMRLLLPGDETHSVYTG